MVNSVQHRKFVVKVGMTAEDVKNSKDATTMQKKYASVFDTDGKKGYSQREADLFNATTFSEKSDGSVIFWTREKDGTKKGTKLTGSVDKMHFQYKNEVKPYTTTKKSNTKSLSVKSESSSSNWFSDWLKDKDKVCTDGKDDGKISFTEGAKSFGKGLMGIVKGAINHPVTTAVSIGAGAVITAIAGTAALPIIVGVGVVAGTAMIGAGIYKACTAKSDGEAKAALEMTGNGTFALVTSALGAKSALQKSAEAGVAVENPNAGVCSSVKQCLDGDVTKSALKVSYDTAKSNMSTLLGSNSLNNGGGLAPSLAVAGQENGVQFNIQANGVALENNPAIVVNQSASVQASVTGTATANAVVNFKNNSTSNNVGSEPEIIYNKDGSVTVKGEVTAEFPKKIVKDNAFKSGLGNKFFKEAGHVAKSSMREQGIVLEPYKGHNAVIKIKGKGGDIRVYGDWDAKTRVFKAVGIEHSINH